MKNLILILSIPVLLSACTGETPKGAVITGKAENLSEGMFILGGPGGARDTITVDEKGAFTINIDEVKGIATYYVLDKNDFQTFKVRYGMDLKLYFDKSDFKGTIRFEGKGADINNYMIAKGKVVGDPNYEWFKLEPADFRVKQDSLLAVYKGLLNTAVKDNDQDEYWVMEEGDVLFTWASNLGMYPAYHVYFTGNQDFKVPDGFHDYRKELNINDARYVKSQAFQNYVSERVDQEVTDRMAKLTETDSTVKPDRQLIRLEVCQNLITSQPVLENFLFNSAVGGMQWEDLDKVKPTIELFRAKVQDPELKAKFEEEFNGWQKLSTGQPAFDFSGKDMQGNPVKLSDFRGKYVYVDVWATWCGPCKYEIPYLDTLETDYEGKNIVFISYSIDEDHAAWLKFVPEHNLKGVQIIGEDAWQSKLCKEYRIQGVPTFMFFDPEGKIISVKMTRPSDPATRKQFDEVL